MFSLFEGETADEVWTDLAKAFVEGKFISNPSSRGGPTGELLHVALSIANPVQRWVTSRRPIINIAFALAEIIWIMRGRHDAKFLTFFNSQLPRYTGSDALLHGAYGRRLRVEFGIDQLERAQETLLSHPSSRQVVLQIWNPSLDLPDRHGEPVSADIPCNVTSMLKIRDGKLDWMQVMRSNDLFRGLPYNIIQFTLLQEIMAGWLNLGLGTYHHISDSLHVYDDSKSYFSDVTRDLPLASDDRLGCSREDSEAYFKILESMVDAMQIDGTPPSKALAAVKPRLPQAYFNIAAVLIAETQRRKGSRELALETISQCSNALYRKMFRAWLERIAAR